jgi:hypothetical protein
MSGGVTGIRLLVRAGLRHVDILFEICSESSEVVRREKRWGGGTVGNGGAGGGTDGSCGITRGGRTVGRDGDEWRG